MRRDDGLLAIMHALKTLGIGAGEVRGEYERSLYLRANNRSAASKLDPSQPLRLHEGEVRPDWADYNEHMTESRYLQAFSDATNAMLHYIGVDKDCLADGNSYYTVETHIVHRQQAVELEPYYVTSQVLDADDKRLHLFHWLHCSRQYSPGNGGTDAAACGYTRSQGVPGRDEMVERVCALAAAQATLPRPDQTGRSVGRR